MNFSPFLRRLYYSPQLLNINNNMKKTCKNGYFTLSLPHQFMSKTLNALSLFKDFLIYFYEQAWKIDHVNYCINHSKP